MIVSVHIDVCKKYFVDYLFDYDTKLAVILRNKTCCLF